MKEMGKEPVGKESLWELLAGAHSDAKNEQKQSNYWYPLSSKAPLSTPVTEITGASLVSSAVLLEWERQR